MLRLAFRCYNLVIKGERYNGIVCQLGIEKFLFEPHCCTINEFNLVTRLPVIFESNYESQQLKLSERRSPRLWFKFDLGTAKKLMKKIDSLLLKRYHLFRNFLASPSGEDSMKKDQLDLGFLKNFRLFSPM